MTHCDGCVNLFVTEGFERTLAGRAGVTILAIALGKERCQELQFSTTWRFRIEIGSWHAMMWLRRVSTSVQSVCVVCTNGAMFTFEAYHDDTVGASLRRIETPQRQLLFPQTRP